MLKFLSSLIVLIFLLISTKSFALPIDWHGFFGVDTNSISNYRGIEQEDYVAGGTGSQEVNPASDEDKAKWQSYLFRLNPVMIVNDSASIKAEFTTGYARGGRFGDDQEDNFDSNGASPNASAALYTYNTSQYDKGLLVTQAYMELYADTATYQIGRHTANWGLGAIYNSGANAWDRHLFSRDGLTANFKIGNFAISPYWAKPTSGNKLDDKDDVKEWGFSLVYDNPEKDMTFGILYSKKKHKPGATTNSGSGGTLTTANVKITDIYLRKAFGNLELKAEIPLMGGDLGDIYGQSTSAKFKAKAFLFEADMKFSESWRAGTKFGHITGHSGSNSNFEALYLNPNYQVANLMFRYNFDAVADVTKNIYDSYMTNSKYVRIDGSFLTEKWDLNLAYIWAKANKTAVSGASSFNHKTQALYVASADQKDDLGMELDFNANYRWNDEITVGASLSYWMVGDFYTFSDSAARNTTAANILGIQANTSIEF